MRDEQDRLPAAPSDADDLVQPLGVGPAQRGRRLVHHDHRRVARERAEDLDLLLLGGPQPPGGHGRREARTPPRRASSRSAGAARAVDAPEPRRGSAPSSTFSATDSRGTTSSSWAISATPWSSASLASGTTPARPSITIRPPSGRDRAGDDLPERRLAGAVLADQRVHRTRLDLQRDAVERQDAAVVLGDVLELDVVSRFPARPLASLAGPLPLELRDVRLRHDAGARQRVDRVDRRRSPCRS